MKPKKITKNDCFFELERLCRLMTERAQDEKSLTECLKHLRPPLDHLARIRMEETDRAEERKAEKAHAEQLRPYRRIGTETAV